jgi:hypothetical protein
MSERKGDWMCTFSDVRYWPADPRPDEVKIIDIAHALSMLCRYTGHVKKFYSVAEHSVLVSMVVPEELALVGLLHDATEAYINDLSRPLKKSLPEYKRLEERNWAAISTRFGLPFRLPSAVHDADTAVLKAEAAILMPPSALTWPLPGPTASVCIECLSPSEAKTAFIERYFTLVGA